MKLNTLAQDNEVLVFRRVIGPKVAPIGTVAVMLDALAAVMVARVAPKKTMLFPGVVLKFVPVMDTASPGLAESGAKEVIVGACPNANCSIKSILIPNTTMDLKDLKKVIMNTVFLIDGKFDTCFK